MAQLLQGGVQRGAWVGKQRPADRLPGALADVSHGLPRALADVAERESVDLTVVVEFGESVPKVSKAIRENVIKRIEGITGLSVTEVNVAINDLYFPGDDVPEESRVE